MLRVFIGYDERQPVAFTALSHSLIKHSSQPLQITPLVLRTLPIDRAGLTPFTYSRFLVPYLCDFEGPALFMDIDMLFTGDVAELFALADDRYDVMVCKNKLRFEWSSLMLFNCARCWKLTPEFVRKTESLHSLEWSAAIGDLPPEWNHLVGYDEPKGAKVIHYTQGVPVFPETKDSEHADAWMQAAREAMSARPWQELMGRSVHADPVRQRLASTT